MAIEARQTAQMIFLDTPENVGEVNAWATKASISKSDLLRRALFGPGWPAVKRELEDEYGALSDVELRYGVLTALPVAERAAYAATYRLAWDSPLCKVPSPDSRPARKAASGSRRPARQSAK